MNLLITERIGHNSYITGLINAYKDAGIKIISGNSNFFHSNFSPDILHIHWPDTLYKWYNMADRDNKKQYEIVKNRLKWYKSNGTKIVHTIHDLFPHNKHNEVDIKFYDLVIQYADILVHHCNKSIEIIHKYYPNSKSKINIVCKHGDFLYDYKYVQQSDARKELQISKDKFVILNFGNQQKYKGIENINSIFNKSQIKNKFLLTAGNYSFTNHSKIQQLFKMIYNYYRQKRTYKSKKYFLKTVELDKIPIIFNSADIVLLGHKAGLNSGVLNMAATFGKPVVFPNIGCFEEQMIGWEYKSYKVNDINDAVAKVEYYNKLKNNSKFSFDNKRWLSENSWKIHVERILKTLQKLNV